MTALLTSLFMVVVAEMGDKTQLIAMAFAAKYRASHVLWGVLIGSLLNHGMAVAVGTYLGEVVPLNLVGLAAGALFIFFGVMALNGGNEQDEETEKNRFGPIATVALAFFLGEMADKTQLTTLTMAVQFRTPLLVLAGAVSGMMVANSPGIFLGDFLFRRVPPRVIKLISAGIFLLFGYTELFERSAVAGGGFTLMVMATVPVVGAICWWMIRRTAQSSAAAGARRAA